MTQHFRLQYKIFNRHLTEFGLPPTLAYLLLPLLFVGISSLIYQKIYVPAMTYPLFAFSFLISLKNADRNEFFKKIYAPRLYQKVRLAEYVLLTLPFVFWLIYKQDFWSGAGLSVGAIILCFLPDFKWHGRALPTPFGRYPFEFTIGFRKAFWVFIIAAVLLGIGINADNFNLGIFAIALLFFSFLNNYSEGEPATYIQIYTCSKKEFLNKKMKTAALYCLVSTLPFAFVLAVFHPAKISFIVLLLCLGILYIWAALLGKYAVYPSKLNILQSFALGFCFMMPPLLLLIIPWFYKKSLANDFLVDN